MASNLSAGRNTLVGSVFSWMNSIAGHRQWVLRPTTQEIGLGIAQGQQGFGSYSAMHVTGSTFNPHPFEYVAWPAAVMPHDLYLAVKRFSVGLFAYGRISQDTVSVVVTSDNLGETWILSDDSLTFLGGNHNAVSFASPADFEADDRLTITVNGLVRNDEPASLTYTVEFFDMNRYLDTKPPSPWAAAQVNRAISADIVPLPLQIDYTQHITRAEFAALTVRLYETATGREITGRVSFNDTNNINVQKAAAIGVMSPTSRERGLFSPNAVLTRQDAAGTLVRLANLIGKPLPNGTADFTDNDKIASWAIEAVGRVQAARLMSAGSGGNFNPTDLSTREECIIAIWRLYDR
jgi:hypothetical protein